MRALFLVNERSGRRRRFDIAELIRQSSSFESELVPCGRKEDLDPVIERAEQEGVDLVFAVGGDGTVHEVAQRLIGRRPALGIVPIGSGNGFARHIGLPMSPALALAACAAGTIATVDTASANNRPFVGVMGLGFDALIAERFASSRVRGLASYIREGFAAFTSRRAEKYELRFEGQTMRTEAVVVAVANSAQYGNEARIAPLASLQDGLLDVVIVRDAGILEIPALLYRLFHGTIGRARGVTSFQTAALSIERAAEGAAHLDGEPLTLPARVDIRIHPQSLRVLVPDGSKRL